MSIRGLSNAELVFLLVLLLAFDASIVIARWLSDRLSMSVHAADIWAYLLLLVATLFLSALAAIRRLGPPRWRHALAAEAREDYRSRP